MKSVTGKPDSTSAAWARRRQWDLRVPWVVVAFVAVGLVIAGQFAEDLADSPPLQMLPPTFSGRRWTVIAVVIYMLVISRVVDRTVQRSISSLERVLRIDGAAFRGYVQRMRPADATVSLVLLAASALFVTGLFVGLGSDLPLTNDPVTGQPLFLPPDALSSVAVLAGYTIMGWAGLSLIFLTVRLGRALGDLCREPLEVDVFDTTNLLPFGNIALAGALAPVGIIVILIVGLGQPTTWLSWFVLLLAAVASILALLLPLRGIHRQMADAKDAVLAEPQCPARDGLRGGGSDGTRRDHHARPQPADEHADPLAQDRRRDDDLAIRGHRSVWAGGADRERPADLHGPERADQDLLDHSAEPLVAVRR